MASEDVVALEEVAWAEEPWAVVGSVAEVSVSC